MIRNALPMTVSGHAAFVSRGAVEARRFRLFRRLCRISMRCSANLLGGANAAGETAAADLRYNLEISLEEAFRGKQTTVRAAIFGRL